LAAVSPDGCWALTAASRSVRLWETATGQPVATLRALAHEEIHSLSFSPDGLTLLAAGGRGKDNRLYMQRWDPAARVLVGPLRARPLRDQVAFLPDGRLAPVAAWQLSPDGQAYYQSHDGVQVWRPARGRSRPADDPELLAGAAASQVPPPAVFSA